MLRSLFVFGLLSVGSMMVSGAPESSQGALCPSLPVQLELRTSPSVHDRYQLVFASIDPNSKTHPDYVDIHYRINNDDSVNLRVMTENAITDTNIAAKQGEVDGIDLEAGDVIRAYATYFAKGYACDTPVHTFNAPERKERGKMSTQAAPRRRRDVVGEEYRNNDYRNINEYRTMRREIPSSRQSRDADLDQYYSRRSGSIGDDVDEEVMMRTQATTCPSIALDQDIVKIQGLDNTYMLTFENSDPRQQLSYVDLHLSTDAAKGWDNIRLASDMQLNLAHRVMQPGVVIKPNEVLKFYWSYRTIDAQSGEAVDCTTEVAQIAPQQITHEITLQQLNAAAKA